MRTSKQWSEYYEVNALSLLDIPWGEGAELSAEEITAVSRSIQEFQVGESSEGRQLLRCAQRYAGRTGDTDYLVAIRLFIAEEQRHARDLARFLKINGIPLVRTTFTDRVFRSLRHAVGGLELSIAVLITAEIIAKVYYAALRDATRSKVLRRLCDQILRDELSHVEFQSEQLFRLRARRGRIGMVATMSLQRFLYAGTVLVVWLSHLKVISRAGYSFRKWSSNCWQEFREAFAAKTPNKAPEPTTMSVTPRAAHESRRP